MIQTAAWIVLGVVVFCVCNAPAIMLPPGERLRAIVIVDLATLAVLGLIVGLIYVGNGGRL